MPSESRRHDLYNGLADLLGVDQAETLMAYLPTTASTELATQADIHRLESRIDALEANLTARIDRMLYAMIAALAVIIAQSFF